MSEKQLIALLHFQMNEGIHLIEIKYEYPGCLDLKYHDSGGNFHSIGIKPNGNLVTYE